MKEKIEEYIKALIEYNEARYSQQAVRAVFTIILTNLVVNVAFAGFTLNSIFIAVVFGFSLLVWWHYTNKKYQSEVDDCKERLDKLHPFDGEEGAVKTLQGRLANFLESVLGKKFTGVKTFDPNQKKDA